MVSSNQSSGIVKRIARNALANYAGQITALALGFLVTPYIVHRLGDSQYGIWGLAGSIIAYLTLVDLGFSTGAARFIAKFEGEGRRDGIAVLVSTLWWVYCGLGAFVLAVAASVVPFLPQFFKIAPELVDTARLTLLLAGMHLAINLPTSLFNATLVGEQRIDLNNIATIIGRLIEAPLSLVLVNVGGNVAALAIASIVATTLIAVIRWRLIQLNLPWVHIDRRFFDRKLLKSVFGFSAFVFGLQITGLIAFNTDNIILGLFLSSASITPFALCYKLANLITQISQPLAAVFFPAFAESQGQNNPGRVRLLFIEGTRIASAICIPVALVFFLGGDEILRVWMGEAYVSSTNILQLLTLSNLTIAAVGSISANLLLGYGRVKSFFLITVGHAVANLALSLYWVTSLQGVGVALGTAIPVVVANLCFIFPLGCHTVGLSVWDGYHKVVWPTLWPALIAIAVYFALKQIPIIANQPLICLAGLGSCYVFAYMLLGSGRDQGLAYLRQIRQAMNQEKGMV